MRKTLLITLTFLLTTFVMISCSASQAEIIVRPDGASAEQSGVTPAVSKLDRESLSRQSPEFYSAVDEVVEYRNLIEEIAAACSHYRAANGALPQRLEDLLDGFILTWPVCAYTGEPFGILHLMPDPNNSNHIGNVYYQRLSDLEGSLYLLNTNPEYIGQSEQVFVVEEVEIKHNLNPQMSNLNPIDNFWWMFNRHVDDTVSSFFEGAMIALNGAVPSDFASMLTDNGPIMQFLIVQEGIDKLSQGIQNNKVFFEIGAYNNGEYYYNSISHFCLIDKNWVPCRQKMCQELVQNWSDLRQRGITYFAATGVAPETKQNFEKPGQCPEGEAYSAIFSSADFDSYEFSESLIITKDQIVNR